MRVCPSITSSFFGLLGVTNAVYTALSLSILTNSFYNKEINNLTAVRDCLPSWVDKNWTAVRSVISISTSSGIGSKGNLQAAGGGNPASCAEQGSRAETVKSHWQKGANLPNQFLRTFSTQRQNDFLKLHPYLQ